MTTEEKQSNRNKQKDKSLDNKMKKVRDWGQLDKIPVDLEEKPKCWITKRIKGIWDWIKREW